MPSVTTEPTTYPRADRIVALALLLATLALLMPWSLWYSVEYARFHIDEHQFIASGALLAREGLVPILDYPYFHLPNLVIAYAAMFTFSDDLMLSVRVVSGIFSWLAISSVAVAAFFQFNRPIGSLLAALATVVMIVCSETFLITSGTGWNHDTTITLALLATLALFVSITRATRPVIWAALAGVLVGLAIGARITWAPFLILFVVTALLSTHRPGRQRLQITAALLVSAAVPLIPTIALLAMVPESFRFCTFGFPLVNLQYMLDREPWAANTFGPKVMFMGKFLVEPGNLAVVGAAIGLLCPAVMLGLRRRPTEGREARDWFYLRLTAGAAALAALTSFIPTPTFGQYYYAAVPFVALGVAAAVGYVIRYADYPYRRGAVMLWAGLVSIALCYAGPRWHRKTFYEMRPDLSWRYHSLVADHLKRQGINGKVLTLSPIPVLQSGGEIYEQLATGIISSRVAPLVPLDQQMRLRLVGDTNIDASISQEMPAAIMTGMVPAHYDVPLAHFAQRHGYTSYRLIDSIYLWLPPGTNRLPAQHAGVFVQP